eukprot:922685-Pelagomonas_calceolata.AAC.5
MAARHFGAGSLTRRMTRGSRNSSALAVVTSTGNLDTTCGVCVCARGTMVCGCASQYEHDLKA